MNEVSKKITELNTRLVEIDKFDISSKSKALLYVKLIESIDNINEIIDNFEINSLNEFRIDREIQMRIHDNKKMKEIINVFAPYILLYQLSNN